MKAMILEKVCTPLIMKEVPTPEVGKKDILVKVLTCGVCRTDLHVVDGELPEPKLPLIPGHQIVGVVEAKGKEAHRFKIGDRVGVPWLGFTCGKCHFCLSGRENLCDKAVFTGYNRDGGYAEYCAADERYAFPLPENSAVHEAPLLCAGLIGYRAFKMTEPAQRIGFYGFGSSAHILIQLACFLNKEVFVFTRPGDKDGQEFAKTFGAKWVGGSDELPPVPLDSAIIFAPVGALMVQALKAVDKGGSVISAGIHMSDIPSFPYSLLWGERSLRSVANLTREDGEEFLSLARQAGLETIVTTFPLLEANEALKDLRSGKLSGSGVLIIEPIAKLICQ